MDKEKQNKDIAPQPVYVAPYPPQSFEEDEIDLIELFRVIWRRKYIIISLTILAASLSVVITLLMPNIYQSEAVLIPREKSKGPKLDMFGALGGMVASEFGIGGGGSIEEMQSVLKSKSLIIGLIKEKNLLPELFPDKWDKKSRQWKEPENAPTLQDGYKALMNILHLNNDKKLGTFTVAVQHKDPVFAKKLVEWLIYRLSETLRQRTLNDARENIKFFQKQIKETTDPLLKEKLYASLAKEMERQTFAMAQKYYGFKVLDPPIVPDKDKKVRPKRSLICIVSTISAFLISIFFVFFLEFLENARERFKE